MNACHENTLLARSKRLDKGGLAKALSVQGIGRRPVSSQNDIHFSRRGTIPPALFRPHLAFAIQSDLVRKRRDHNQPSPRDLDSCPLVSPNAFVHAT
jgi:hypothetical protein